MGTKVEASQGNIKIIAAAKEVRCHQEINKPPEHT